KQLNKGLDQLMDEGVAQMFVKELNGDKIIGTVGALQFDVIQYRLEHEYGARCDYEPLSIHKACWIEAPTQAIMQTFISRKKKDIARDKDDKPVFLAESAWVLKMTQENFPDIAFHFTSEFG
ncbi:MAG: peptide chain release factor 3, partial [Saprospiraceae bacterium]